MKIILLLLLVLPLGGYAQSIKTIAGTGIAGYSGDGGAAVAAQLNSPDAVKFDRAGNMYIADEYNHVIRKINTSGVISTFAGTGIGGYTGDGGMATNAQLKRPLDLVFDSAGNLFIAEFGNNIIRKISTSGIVSTIAGTGSSGFSGDGGLAIHAELYDPLGLIFDNFGNLFFSDNGNRRVRKIDASGIITTVAGTGVAGFSGDGGPATAAEFYFPGYIKFSSTGELYVPDYINHRIRKINSLGIITTIAGDGVAANTGDGGPASAASLLSAFAILFDVAGNLYLSDRGEGVIRKINSSGTISTIAGTGILGYYGDGGPAISAKFNLDVNCSAIDGAGNLYVADPYNNRVRRITYNNIGVFELDNLIPEITTFPNPTSDKLFISHATNIETAMVVNMLGQVVMTTYPLAAREVTLNVGSLPAGVYCVMVNGVYGGRFVKE